VERKTIRQRARKRFGLTHAFSTLRWTSMSRKGSIAATAVALAFLTFAFFASFAIAPNSAFANFNNYSSTSCLNCHSGDLSGNAGLSATFYIDGSATTSVNVNTASSAATFQIDWFSSGVFGSTYDTMSYIVNVPDSTWTVAPGDNTYSGMSGWNTNWDYNNSNTTGTTWSKLFTSDTNTVWQTQQYVSETNKNDPFGQGSGTMCSDGNAAGGGDKCNDADLDATTHGTDAIITVPSGFPTGTYYLTIFGIGHLDGGATKGHIEWSITVNVTGPSPTYSIADGTDPSNFNAQQGSTGNYIDQLVGTASGGCTMSGVTVTTTNTADVSSVSITNVGGGTTYGSQTTPSGNNWSISGLTLGSGTYEIRTNVASGATVNDVVTAYVSAATGSTCTPSTTDTATTQMTITAPPSYSIADGTDPSNFSAQQGSTGNYIDQLVGTSVSSCNMTGVTVTTANTADVSSVSITNVGGGTTYGTQTTPSGNNWSISGLTLGSGTYEIRLNVASGATVNDVVTAYVSAATGDTCTPSTSDTATTQLTVTAAPAYSIADGSDPANFNGQQGSTGNYIDQLVGTAAGGCSMSGVTVTTTNTADVSGVSITNVGGGTTYGSQATPAGNNWSITGLSLSSGTYEIRVDVAGGATPSDIVTAYVSAATGDTCTPSTTDTATTQMTVTVPPSYSIADGTDPSNFNAQQGSTGNYIDQLVGTAAGGCSMSGVTVTTTNTADVSGVSITNVGGGTTYGSQATPAGNNWSITGLSLSSGTYEIRVNVAGGATVNDVVTAYVSAATGDTCTPSTTDTATTQMTVIAPPSYSIADGTDPSNFTGYLGSTGNYIDQLVGTAVSGCSMSGVTVTTTNTADVSGVSITNVGGGTTYGSQATPAGNNWSITGLSLSSGTYEIRVNVAGGATPTDVVTAYVSAASGDTCTPSTTDTATTQMTISASPTTTTVTDGTDPGASNPCPGSSGVSLDAFSLNETSGNGSASVSSVTLSLTGNTQMSTVYVTCGGSSGSQASPGASQSITLSPSVTVPASSTVNCTVTADLTNTEGGSVNASVTSFTVTGTNGGVTDTGTAQTIQTWDVPAVTNFAASDGEDSQSTLTWTNPNDNQLSQVVVMRKTGSYPANHLDGTQVYLENPATKNQARNTVDSPLSNGTVYYYATFVRGTSCWNETVSGGTSADTGTPTAAAAAYSIADGTDPSNFGAVNGSSANYIDQIVGTSSGGCSLSGVTVTTTNTADVSGVSITNVGGGTTYGSQATPSGNTWVISGLTLGSGTYEIRLDVDINATNNDIVTAYVTAGTGSTCTPSTTDVANTQMTVTVAGACDKTIDFCYDCHAYPPVDGTRSWTTGAVVGSHQPHVAAGAVCSNCHVDPGSNLKHRDGNIAINGTSVTYSKGNNFPQVSTVSSLGYCTNTACHDDGIGNKLTTPTWGTTAAACTECHAAQPSSGSHSAHLALTTIGCGNCHDSAVKGTTYPDQHLDGNIDVYDVASGDMGYPQNKTKNTPYSQCTNASCHDNGTGTKVTTPTWGSSGGCSSCHQTQPATGSHTVHLAVTGVSCGNCHDGAVEGTTFPEQHSDNNIDVYDVAPGDLGYPQDKTKNTPYSYCTNASCHDNGTGAKVSTPTWGTTISNCSECHATQPATGSHTAHLAVTGVSCGNCHDSAVEGTTAPTEHLDGNVDVYDVASGDLGYPANKTKNTAYSRCTNASCHDNGTGAKVTTPTWGTTISNCSECHATQPASGSHSAHLALTTISCGNCHDSAVEGTTAPTQHLDGNIDVYDVASGDLGYPADKTKNTAYSRCTNASCHDNGTGTKVTTPTWGSSGGCSSCHQTRPATGSHTAHLNDTSIGCGNCHDGAVEGTTFPEQHSDNNIDVYDVTSGDLGYPADKTKNTPYSQCTNASCHENGRLSKVTTPTWGTTVSDCSECHATQPATGSHTAHLAVTGVSCGNCHDSAVEGTTAPTEHRDGNVDVYDVASGDLGYPANKTKNTAFSRCTNAICHDNGTGAKVTTPTWGTTISNCSECHATQPATGSHTAHLGVSGVSCGNCHDSAVEGTTAPTQHLDGNIDVYDVTSGDLGYPQNKTKNTAYAQCNNASCHDNGTGTKVTTPTWGTTISDCSECHANQPSSGSHSAHLALTTISCGNCHDSAVQGTTAPTQHLDGNIDVYDVASGDLGYPADKTKNTAYSKCTNASCHDNGTGTKVTTPTWGSSGGCSSCHQTRPATGSHTAHLNDTSIGCGNCHDGAVEGTTFPAQHSDNNIDVYDVNPGDLGYPQDKTKNTPYSQCTNASCHENGRLSKVTTPTWGTTVSDCSECHATQPATGSHTAHLGRTFVSCGNCHDSAVEGTTAPTEHRDGNVDVYDVTSGDLGYPANKTKNTAFSKCTNASCHDNGTGALVTTPTWGTTINDCSTCHATQPATGSHTAHLAVTGVSCGNCHDNAIEATQEPAQHLDGNIDVYDVTSGDLGYPQNKTKNTAYARCNNASCHDDGTGTLVSTPTWGTTVSDCSECHANQPTTGNHSNHLAYTIAKCGSCHDSAVQGTTPPTQHLDGTIDVYDVNPGDMGYPSDKPKGTAGSTCTNASCHENGRLTKTTTPTWGSPANSCGNGLCHGMPPTTGSHTPHLTTTKKPTAPVCADCHDSAVQGSTAPTQHLDGNIDVYDAASGDLGYPANKTKNTAGSRCTNAYCHDDGTGTKVTSPTWGSTVAECSECHQQAPSTGSHTAHLAVSNVGCGNCHDSAVQGTTAPLQHLDGNIDVYDVSSGDLGYPANKTKNTAYAKCNNASCHDNGTGTKVTTPTWGTTVSDCSECHANQPTSGSHSAHLANTGFGCGNCHGDAVKGTSAITGQHVDGNIDVFDVTQGDLGYPSNKQKNSAYSYCSNFNCHGLTSPTWNTTNSGSVCTTCHGVWGTASPTDAQIAPGGSGVDTGGNSSNTSPRVGAHQAHLTGADNITNPLPCSTCHTKPTNWYDTGHLDASTAWDNQATISFNIPTTIGSMATPYRTQGVYSGGPGGTCSNVYCHDARVWDGGVDSAATIEFEQPDWNTPMMTQTGSPGICDNCHGYPPGGSHYGTDCAGCHYVSTKGDFVNTNNLSFASGNKGLHIDGNVTAQGGDCTACHGAVASGGTPHYVSRVIAGTGEFANTKRHVYGGTVTQWECIVCHMEGDYTTGNTDSAYHKTGNETIGTASTQKNVALRNVDTRALAARWVKGSLVSVTNAMYQNMDTFCLTCHDANGANGIAVAVGGGSINTNPSATTLPAAVGGQTLNFAPFNDALRTTNTKAGDDTAVLSGNLTDWSNKGKGPNWIGTSAVCKDVGFFWDGSVCRPERTKVVSIDSMVKSTIASHGIDLTGYGSRYTSHNTNWQGWMTMTLKSGTDLTANKEASKLHCADCHTVDLSAHSASTDFMLTGGSVTGNCWTCHPDTVYNGPWGTASATNETFSRFPHTNGDPNIGSGDSSVFGASVCLNCHGGAPQKLGFGGIHGIRTSSTAYSVDYRTAQSPTINQTSYRFIGGAYMAEDGKGWTAGATTSTCYFDAGTTSQPFSNCSHHSGTQTSPKGTPSPDVIFFWGRPTSY